VLDAVDDPGIIAAWREGKVTFAELEALTRAPRSLYEAHCRLLDREPERWPGEDQDMVTESKRVFFNNCRARPHATLYGAGAFYDLDRVGRQATMATDLQPGDECVVATPTREGDIDFDWFSFSREAIMTMPDEPGTKVRVLFGERIRSQTLSKAHAAEMEPYKVFFNVNGHFKRPSVIRPRSSR
jgi:hypothetical protein